MDTSTATPWFMAGDAPATLAWPRIWQETAGRFAGLPAVSGAHGEVTYGQLAARAEEIGRSIPAQVSIVAVDARANDFLVACIALWNAGCAVVPFARPHLAEDTRLEKQIFTISGAVYEHGVFTPTQSKISVPSSPDWHGVFFTSGSTGAPRAVVRGWRQALYEAGHYVRVLGLAPGAQCRMLIEPVFGASTKHLLGCLLSGCTQISGDVENRECDVLYGTPGQVAAFAGGARERFRWVSMTGEACSPGPWQAAASLCVPGGRCLNALGGTEFGVAANSVVAAHDCLPTFLGKPLPLKHLSVVSDDGSVLPSGEAGLLRVESQYLAEGYLDMRAGKAVLSPFATGADTPRSFMTGDVAVLENGTLRVLGRTGNMLKRGARWLDVSPLRNCLSSAPGVRAVFIGSAASAGEKLRAWIELDELEQHSFTRVVQALASSNLPDPLAEADVFAVRSLPRNRHGKTDLAALQDLESKLGPNEMLVHRAVSRVSALADAIWSDNTPETQPDLASLDSLAITELCHAMERLVGRDIPPAVLLGGGTYGEIRRAIADRNPSGCRVIGCGESGVLLWFGGGLVSAMRAVGENFKVIHWDLDSLLGAEKIRGSTLRDVARECLDMPDNRNSWHNIRIGGFSYGALVAYESACLLAGECQAVDGCVLLDPPDIGERAIANLRWSAIRASLLLALLSPVARWFPYRIRRETRNARLATRRALMRRYRPSRGGFPLRILVCPGNHAATYALFSPAAVRLSVTDLPVTSHMQVVRDSSAIRVWGKFLRSVFRANTEPQ